MLILLSFVLLLVSIAAVIAVRVTRPGVSFTWLAAAIGAMFAWVSVLLWQFILPRPFTLGQWAPQTLYSAGPQFSADSFSWLYALSVVALAAAVILTFPARGAQARMPLWLGTLVFTVLGLLAVLADNTISLVLTWMAIDLVEFAVSVRAQASPSWSLATVSFFSIRLLATGFVIWAGVLGNLGGQPFLLETAPRSAGTWLLLAAGLRLVVLPLVASRQEEQVLERGFGSMLRLTAAAAALVLLARLPAGAVDPAWNVFLLTCAALGAFYGGWKWLFSENELQGHSYWMVGMGALALAATLVGHSLGSISWGVSLILFGGLSFLYSAKHVWFTRFFAILSLLMLGLPFTLTASAWPAEFPLPFLFWPIFLVAHSMLVAGYLRHILRPADTQLLELPSWAQAAYPIGMALLVVPLLLGGLWGWPGALSLGVWPAALAGLLLTFSIVFAFVRLPQLADAGTPARVRLQPPRFMILLMVFPRLAVWLVQLTGQLIMYVSTLLEGDGGLLWTLLLLVLLSTILRGR